MKIIIILLILLPTFCFAGDWSKEDTYREVTWQVLHAIDIGQTRDIAKNPDRFYEINPILGKHPSVEEVNRYAVASSLVHFGISYFLPKEYRKWWQYVSIGISTGIVSHNYDIGLKVDF
jgi:hypothetical protein